MRRRRRRNARRLALSRLAVPRKVAVPRHPRRALVEPLIAEERKSKARCIAHPPVPTEPTRQGAAPLLDIAEARLSADAS